MESARTILKLVKKYDQYLAKFPVNQRPAIFEELIAKSFTQTLYLPFHTRDNDDTNVKYRVSWRGSASPPSVASQGPDIIAYCYEFDLLIEATLKTGANQWTQEFASSARHCEDHIGQKKLDPNNLYAILVTPKLCLDTYRSIHQHPKQEFNFIPIEVWNLEKILQTSILAPTTRHLDLRGLFHQIRRCITKSSSLMDYCGSVDNLLTQWQKNIFGREKNVFIGVKSYEMMRRIQRELRRKSIDAVEILQKLQKHPFVAQYHKIIHEKLLVKTIEDSLIQGGFATTVGHTMSTDETVFEPVPYQDFRARELRLIGEVRKVNGSH